MKTIKAIYGFEPGRENEFPQSYMIGSGITMNGVTSRIASIVPITENYGEYALCWYEVITDKGETYARVAARAIAEIVYEIHKETV